MYRQPVSTADSITTGLQNESLEEVK